MKRCPTCGNTYTNDGLVFCLEDGARLTPLSNPQSSFDPEATLHLSAEESPPLPPTESPRPQGAQTIRQLATPHTAAPRQPQATIERQPSPAAAAPAPPPKSTSPAIVAGITAIVVLLLVIAGIGIALLVRDSPQGSNGSAVENNNPVANRETANRSSSNTANDGGAYNSANRAVSNSVNRNGSSTNPSGSAEAKVVRGAALDESDLTALSGEELRRLRNTVYARHGRTFDSPDLQRYFDKRPWYRPRSDYSEASLTAADLANIKLIQAVENSR
ncbi:MAG TPA: YARHG domain-containing protein [Pyrinomonadaceae bacterium]|jgi:hypothetical protein